MQTLQDKPYDLLCTGTALIDSIIRGFDPNPVSATGYRAESASLNVGGEAVNASVTASALGLKTAILAFADKGFSGELIASYLEKAGVGTAFLVRTGSHPTPVSTLFVEKDGKRHTITNGAHSFNFHPELYPEALNAAKIVSFGSLFRAPYNDPEVLYNTVSAIEGALLFADTKLPNFRKLTLSDVEDSLKKVDFIFPNEDEARYYTGFEDPDDMADEFLRHGVKNVIIKLGERGCLLKNGRERIRLSAHRMKVVDTTGAGDNFLAGFAAATLMEKGLEQCLRFASACGAIVCTAVGACGILKGREEAENLLNTQPVDKL